MGKHNPQGSSGGSAVKRPPANVDDTPASCLGNPKTERPSRLHLVTK